MKWIVALCLIPMMFLACTQSKNTQKANQSTQKVPYESLINYEFAKMSDFANAAEVEGSPVSWSQLSSQAPALQELEMRWHQRAMVHVYKQAVEMVAQKKLPGETATIDFFFEAPEGDPSQILKKIGIEVREEITVNFMGPQESGVIAKVADTTFTDQDLLSVNLSNAKLFKNLFTQRMRRLNGIVIRRYILKASKEQNMPMEGYIKKNILPQVTEVTNAMVMDFAKRKGISEGDINELMMDRLKDIIRQEERDAKVEKYTADKLIKVPVKVAFRAPELSIQEPKLSNAVPYWGREDGSSVLFVGHWSCENCGSPLELFLEAKNKFGKSLKGRFLYSFPDRDREMRMSAEAGMCLYHQKPELLWGFMAQFLKQGGGDNSEKSINQAARDAGANYEEFRKCFLAREHKKAVDSHLAHVKGMGIYKTPVIVIEGRVFEAPFDSSEVSKALMAFAGGKDVIIKKVSFLSRIKQFFMNIFS